ncbi:MAG: hypothetical protein IPN34_15245 [Planctomycetes bacterium]|nr:hypothetical protein [Planctomycetota bacterium]
MLSPLLGGLQQALRAELAMQLGSRAPGSADGEELCALHLVGFDSERGELQTELVAGPALVTTNDALLFAAADELHARLHREGIELVPLSDALAIDPVQRGLREFASVFGPDVVRVELRIHHDGLLRILRLARSSEEPLPRRRRPSRSAHPRVIGSCAEICDPRCGSFWENASLEELARRQGVGPVTDLATLMIEWPEDDVDADFLELLRSFRHS